MNNLKKDNLENDVINFLESIKNIPQRNDVSAVEGKKAFLAEARNLKSIHSTQPVSNTPLYRLNKWIVILQNYIYPRRGKERFKMFSTIVTIAVALSVLFGGAGITAYAAQDALPNDALYGLKLFGEDLRLNFTNDPQEDLDLTLAYAERRLNESAALYEDDEPIDEPLATRYRQHLNYALNLAAANDDDDLRKALIQIRSCLELHNRIMIQLQTNMPDGLDPAMNQIRDTIRSRMRMVDLGLEDPLQYRLSLQQNFQSNGEMPVDDPQANQDHPGVGDQSGTPVQDGSGPGPGNSPNQTPGNRIEMPGDTPGYDPNRPQNSDPQGGSQDAPEGNTINQVTPTKTQKKTPSRAPKNGSGN